MPRAHNSKRRGTRPPPLRMGPVVARSGGLRDAEACVMCGAVQPNKYDTTLMCSEEHATCFSCVSANVQPHALCGDACNGFKYKCAGCEVWLCVNRTQELAVMCGGHSLARARLSEEDIAMRTFDVVVTYAPAEDARSCSSTTTTSSSESGRGDDDDTGSSEESGGCACSGRRNAWHGARGEQLPRVCNVDWSVGGRERSRRLARLRQSLLGRNA